LQHGSDEQAEQQREPEGEQDGPQDLHAASLLHVSVRRLFVYGTLRRGAPMHGLLEPGARFVGPARFRGRLYDLGAFPGVVASRRAADVVHGELFELTGPDPEAALDALDRYEGRFFHRVEVDVETAERGVERAWIYLYRGELARSRRIASGDFLAAPGSGAARPPTRAGRSGPRD
jgi:gamma-glutamylcyclotransferase (GGCT)/AIG2-like uncharacterized protein YtfP